MTTRSMYCATHTRFIKMNLLPNIDGTHEGALTQISWRTISSCSDDLIDPHAPGGGRAHATWHMHRTARRGVSGAAPRPLLAHHDEQARRERTRRRPPWGPFDRSVTRVFAVRQHSHGRAKPAPEHGLAHPIEYVRPTDA